MAAEYPSSSEAMPFMSLLFYCHLPKSSRNQSEAQNKELMQAQAKGISLTLHQIGQITRVPVGSHTVAETAGGPQHRLSPSSFILNKRSLNFKSGSLVP